jgi:WD40 repeat protein
MAEKGPRVEAKGGWSHLVAYSPDGKLLAAEIGERETTRLVLLDPATLAEKETLLKEDASTIDQLHFSADGNGLWCSSNSSRLHVWDLSGKVHKDLTGVIKDGSRPVCFVGHDDLLFQNVHNDQLFVFDLAAEAARRKFRFSDGHEGQMFKRSVGFSGDGQILATGDMSGKVVLWELPSAKHGPAFEAHSDKIVGLCISPDGRLLATAGYDDKVKVWSLRK